MYNTQCKFLRSAKEDLLISQEKITKERWKEYYMDAFALKINRRVPETKDTNDIDPHALEQALVTDTDIDIEIGEIKNAITALKNNKASSNYGQNAEICKQHNCTNIA
jgi:hypothetical protein